MGEINCKFGARGGGCSRLLKFRQRGKVWILGGRGAEECCYSET